MIATVWCLAVKTHLDLAVKLALVDFAVHFMMDRLKAGPRYLGRFKPLFGTDYMKAMQSRSLGVGSEYETAVTALDRNRYFWWSLGFDQAVHHLTHYYIIFRLVTAG